jgi:hypothetical protein
MLILAFKLFITPLLIGGVTFVGRRWGSIVSGLLIGLPLTSGPISFILAHEHGLDFAAQSAVGNLAGQISNCIFCLAYIQVAKRCNWLLSSLAAIAAFFAATFALNCIVWALWPAFITLLLVIVGAGRLIPRHAPAQGRFRPPSWDLPGRIVTATGFVLLLTTAADALGPQLSGLISPFPAFSVIFAAFAQYQQGAKTASNLLRGVVLGSGSYAAFFVIVGGLLPPLGITLTYLLASLVAVSVGAIFYFTTQRTRRPAVGK